jgi:TPR repeat protein
VNNSNQPDAQTRAVLLKEARSLMAENADFSVHTLLLRTNVSREEFYRCFADKTGLLSALAQEDVKGLSEILDVAQPAAQSLAAAVNAPAVSPPSPSANDQWLERRLRVFERALNALEKHQEKSEQSLAQAIALLNEKLERPAAEPEAPAEPDVPAAAPVVHALPDMAAMTEAVMEPVAPPEHDPVAEAAPKSVPEPEPDLFRNIEFSVADIALATDAAIAPPAAEQDSKEEPQAAAAETHDFLAHARQAARDAALAETVPPKARKTPWLAWAAAVAMLLLVSGMGLFFTGHLTRPAMFVPAPLAGAGITHRQVAKEGLPRTIALADNGNAGAETLLALAYLKGNGVPSDAAAAMRWSQAAAGQGQPVAQYVLGTLYVQDKRETEAAHWFAAAAAQGNIKAMHNLAIAYAQGQGVEQDAAQAVSWFERAAALGYHDSEFDLAVMYERGMGVPQDATAALKWYLIAAAGGDAPSAARAQFLKTQLDATQIQAASDAAAAFVVQPAGTGANDITL